MDWPYCWLLHSKEQDTYISEFLLGILNGGLLRLKFQCLQHGEEPSASAKIDSHWILHGWDWALSLKMLGLKTSFFVFQAHLTVQFADICNCAVAQVHFTTLLPL